MQVVAATNEGLRQTVQRLQDEVAELKEEARLLAELEAIEREAQRKKEEILAKLAKAREKQ